MYKEEVEASRFKAEEEDSKCKVAEDANSNATLTASETDTAIKTTVVDITNNRK